MSKSRIRFNAFYAVLMVVGVAFTITACAYGLMLVRSDRRGRGDATARASELIIFLQDHGAALLTGELLVLGATTVGAIWLDDVRSRRDETANYPTKGKS